MNFDNERKAFEEWAAFNGMGLYIFQSLGKYANGDTEAAWQAWLASANREGYKLVPLQPTTKIMVAIERKVEEQLEASAIDADPFRLDGENIYKAMIGACDD